MSSGGADFFAVHKIEQLILEHHYAGTLEQLLDRKPVTTFPVPPKRQYCVSDDEDVAPPAKKMVGKPTPNYSKSPFVEWSMDTTSEDEEMAASCKIVEEEKVEAPAPVKKSVIKIKGTSKSTRRRYLPASSISGVTTRA